MTEELLYMQIGANVKYNRLSYNLDKPNAEKITQEKLSELIGTSTSLIGNLESENVLQGISIYTLWKISEVLNVPIQNFFKERP